MTNEGEARVLKAINNQAHAYITIGEELNETLNGNRFVAQMLTTLATGASMDIGIEIPSTRDIRLTGIGVGCDLNFAKGLLYEDVTFTGSTEIDVINSNRQAELEHVSGIKVYSAFLVPSTITTEKIIDIIATLGGSTTRVTSIGGSDSGQGFFLLKRSTKYLLRISNEDGVTANILLRIPFIETDLTD